MNDLAQSPALKWVTVPGPLLVHEGGFYKVNTSPRQVRVTSIEGNGYVYYKTPQFGSDWSGLMVSDIMELTEFSKWVASEIIPNG